jgi:RNA polymerase sigma-70 factor (ECF subfamily)
LSEPLRAVVVLRYFTRASSYDSMAAVLGIPVGTVRSRLSEARRKLGSLLREQASLEHGDHAALVRSRRALFDEIHAQYNRGLGCTSLVAALRPDAVLHKASSRRVIRGAGVIARGIQGDIDAGMRLRLLDVIAGQDITVVEGAFDNPPEHPEHCPQFTTQVFFHQGDYIRAIRLHYAAA